MSTRNKKFRAVHISTVHSALDPRIRLKQLRSIAAHGMEAWFISGDPSAREMDDGVRLRRVSTRRRGRLRRMLLLAPKAVWLALCTPATVYHLHDPELLPWAWILLLRRVPVFYDIHEDYSLAMQKKFYLPRWSRRVIGRVVALFERVFSLPFHHIIAEYAYAARFPRATPILNYPPLSLLDSDTGAEAESRVGAEDPVLENSLDTATGKARLLYTGYVTVERGALNIARVLRELPDVEVTLAGRCFPNVARRMREVAGESAGEGATEGSVKEAERLHIVGEGRYVPFDEIRSYYARGGWTAGLVLIPDLTHFKEKHLTKFFEFMAFGLPIIASDFPAWRRLIADQGIGFCVDPEDPQAVGRAIERLRTSPAEAREMGRRGRELVRQKYNWDGQAQTLVEIYNSYIVK